MPDFMVMVLADESREVQLPAAELKALVEGHSAYEEKLRAVSAFLDGPFLESKEVIGGLFFTRMASIEEAVSWASETECVKIGSVEIRELWRS